MLDTEDNKQDPKGQSSNDNASSQDQDDKSKDIKTDPVTPELPDRFKGKSAEDIAKSYIELEKKYGEHTQEVGTIRERLQEWQALGTIISQNPELKEKITGEIEKVKNGNLGENSKKDTTPVRDDTRKAIENTIIGTFENEYGLNKLPEEKRKDLYVKIGNEIAEMVDPKGIKSVQQAMNDIALDKLPIYLKKAYRLATLDDAEEKARFEGFIQARQNNEAAIGSLPSSGVKGEESTLTPLERETARKMKMSEKDYLEYKIKIAKGE